MSEQTDRLIDAAIDLIASFEGFADLNDTEFLDHAVVSRRKFVALRDAVLNYVRHPAVRDTQLHRSRRR